MLVVFERWWETVGEMIEEEMEEGEELDKGSVQRSAIASMFEK